MAHETVLVVDDEEDILELVKYNLEKEGYTVVCVTTGEDALAATRMKMPDVVVLDLMLPGVDGLEVCRRLKGDLTTRHIPVIMLTAKGSEADIVAGLELGAADYVTKPFSPRVLTARVKAVLRRESEATEEDAALHVNDIVIHPGRHEVLVGDAPVDLTVTEFRILLYLARRPGWVFTRQQIVDAAQGDDVYVADRYVTERSVDVHIVSLRRKLGKAGSSIETVRGVGYRLRDV
ncbi:MAG TPA: response regulator [Thermoleophilia bacterium]|nr:response regulator [Thermoleophilia bacterium]HQG03224.1 response regulator [Thermoleophilia bacterium]HQG54175.1 response regulator [Thermoleophilia bacterium]HQJ97379.1 response regulator [Thermoleophilia bacterium]